MVNFKLVGRFIGIFEYVASDVFRPQVAILPGEIDRLIEAHRRKPVVPTRTEVVARFDQPVVREIR